MVRGIKKGKIMGKFNIYSYSDMIVARRLIDSGAKVIDDDKDFVVIAS